MALLVGYLFVGLLAISGAFLEAPQDQPLVAGTDVAVPKRIAGRDPSPSIMAREARIQGYLVFEVTVNPEGRITDIKTLRGIPLVDQDAIEAMKTWRYEPTVVDGRARAVRFTETVDMFLSTRDKFDFYEKWASDHGNKPVIRVHAISRLALLANKERKSLVKLLTRLSEDPDAEVAKAAKGTLDALPPPKK